MTDHNADAGGGGFGSSDSADGNVMNIAAATATANSERNQQPSAVPDAAALQALAAARENDLAFFRNAASNTTDAQSAKSKRTASLQISKEDYNCDADGEEGDATSGGFAKADASTLAKRRIVKGRRPDAGLAQVTSTTTISAATTESTTATTSNPFASLRLPPPNVAGSAIALIGASAPGATTTTTTSASTNPFSNIAFKASSGTTTSSSTTDAGGIFGSGSSFPKFGSGIFGGASAATSTAAATTPGSTTASTASFIFGSGVSTSNGTSSWFSPPPAGTSPFAFASAPALGTTTATTSSDTSVPTPAESKKEILPEHVELSTGEEGEELIIEIRVRTYKLVLDSAENGTKGSGGTNGATGGDQDGSTPSVPPSSSTAPMLAKQVSNVDDQKIPPAGVAVEQDQKERATESSCKHEEHTEGKANATSDAKDVVVFRWQEIGIGPLRLLQLTANTSLSRLVQRRESTPNGSATKVILNVPLWKGTEVKRPSEKHVQITTLGYDDSAPAGAAAPVPETYLFKLITPMEAAQLFDKIKEAVDRAKSCVGGNNSHEEQQQPHP